MKIGFWNTRRLAAGSPEQKAHYIQTAVKRLGTDCMILCELVGTTGGDGPYFPTPQNLTYRRPNVRQLCYGCLDKDGNDKQLTRYTPHTTIDYQNVGLSNINNFTQLVDRGVAHVQLPLLGGMTLNLYGFHAPANNASATTAICFLVCDLKVNGGAHWILLGDMNVEPEDFNEATNNICSGDMFNSGCATYKGKAQDKEYDYAFGNVAGADLHAVRRSTRATNGDHDPVLLEF